MGLDRFVLHQQRQLGGDNQIDQYHVQVVSRGRGMLHLSIRRNSIRGEDECIQAKGLGRFRMVRTRLDTAGTARTPHMKFFDTDWVPIGTRAQLAAEIERVTGIEARFLDGSEEFRSASIATRLSWQSRRKTTEEEDMAYSLVGIMGVSLVPIYGEGRQSFLKLQQELLKSYRDESIFSWTAPASRLPKHDRQWGKGEWGLLAPWVDCFQDSRDVVSSKKMGNRPAGGISPIAGGIKFPMPGKELRPMKSWEAPLVVLSLLVVIGPFIWLAIKSYRHSERQEWSLTLNCWKKDHFGRFRAIQVFLCRDSRGDEF